MNVPLINLLTGYGVFSVHLSQIHFSGVRIFLINSLFLLSHLSEIYIPKLFIDVSDKRKRNRLLGRP
jgi:hypothetical protein